MTQGYFNFKFPLLFVICVFKLLLHYPQLIRTDPACNRLESYVFYIFYYFLLVMCPKYLKLIFILGEIFELKGELNSDKKERKKEAVKKVIASMTVGKDVRYAM